jgi:hypothetical protein
MWGLKRLRCHRRAQVQGVAFSVASQSLNNWRLWGSEMKSRGSEMKCRGRNMKPWDSMTTTTPRPSPSIGLSFTLVNYFILYRAHINTFKTNCIATCIANGTAARNSVADVATPPPLPPFGQPLQAPIHFLSLDFQFLHFYSFSYCSLIDAAYSFTWLRSLIAELARRHAQR